MKETATCSVPDESGCGKEVLPRILYIMGTGRSGTTICEILLTNNRDVAGVGEVTHIFQDGFLDNAVCACGATASSCQLWSNVRHCCNWLDSELPGLRDLFSRMAWHSHFPRVAAGIIPQGVKARFQQVNDCLFRSVAAETGASVVVDSSKYAGRALALARAFPGQVGVICLTRSPAGLLAAFQREDADEQKSKSLFATAAYYLYTLACFRVVKWILGRGVLPIRYEDLAAQPIEALDRIEAWSGLDFSRSRNKIKEKQLLEIGHIVTGNRLRRNGPIQFRSQNGSAGTVPAGILARPVLLFLVFYRRILGF